MGLFQEFSNDLPKGHCYVLLPPRSPEVTSWCMAIGHRSQILLFCERAVLSRNSGRKAFFHGHSFEAGGESLREAEAVHRAF